MPDNTPDAPIVLSVTTDTEEMKVDADIDDVNDVAKNADLETEG